MFHGRYCTMMTSAFNAGRALISSEEPMTQEGDFYDPIGPLPQLQHIRRIPVRYRDMLPLRVMQQHRCAVVGVARGILTVAVTSPRQTALIELLARFTGYGIFPVYVQSARMDLLLKRAERWQRAQIRGSFSLRQDTLVFNHVIGALLALCDWQIKG